MKIASPVFTLILLALLSACQPAPKAGLIIQSPVDLPAGTPITLSLPSDLNCCEGNFLRAKGTSSKLSIQAVDEQKFIFSLEAPLAANTSRQYDLIENAVIEVPAKIEVQPNETGILVTTDQQAVFQYNTATIQPPMGAPDYYQRSGFIHPFYSPGGKVLTDGFPVGHTHQHGIFFAWVNTTYRRTFTDFWNQQRETGTVAFRALNDTLSGPVMAQIQTAHEFISTQHGPVLQEHWTVRSYPHPKYHILDITSTQKMLSTDTLFVNKYHYGGMGIRAAAEWNQADSSRFSHPMQFITSEGITRDSANHTRPKWAAAFGPLVGGTAGLAIFDHPDNFQHPQPVRIHPVMPYFCLAPMVEGAFTLVPGQEYTSTYRILSYEGDPDTRELEAMWKAYTANISVEWIRN